MLDAGDGYDFEAALLEFPRLVGLLEPTQDDVERRHGAAYGLSMGTRKFVWSIIATGTGASFANADTVT